MSALAPRWPLARPTLAALLLLAGIACTGEEPSTTTAYVNGNVVTVDADFRVARAFLVAEGRFVAVGSDEEVRATAPRGATIVDLEGATVLPGFNDNHIHLGPGGGLQAWQGGLVPALPPWSATATTMEALMAAIREEASARPEGEWIRGGLTRMDWPNDKVPTRWQLDTAAPEHPVLLTRGPHTYLLNSVALELAGIDRDTPDPEGGWIFRRDDGEANGRVLEAARRIVDRVAPPEAPAPSDEEGLENMRTSLQQLLDLGITSVNIAGVRPDGIGPIEALYERWGDELPRATMQVRLSPGHDSYDDPAEGIREEIAALEALPRRTGEGDDRFKIGAIKMSIDGGLSAPVFWSLEPYEGRPDFFGAVRIPADVFYPVAKRAHELGWQLGIHAMGDGAVAMVAEQMAKIIDEVPRETRRHYMHHVAVKPPAATLETMAAHDIMVASQPAFTVGLGAYAHEALNDEREATQNPTASLQEAGIIVSHGSDSAPYGPLLTIWTAATRIGFDGDVDGPEEAVSVPEAIRLHTVAPAYFTFDEDKKGSIAPGMLADFIVLSDDILSVPAERIRDLRVLRTFLAGNEKAQRPR